jgi:hypothetical protein
VFVAAGDLVALGCYAAALAGRQQQAIFELWESTAVVGQRPQTVTLTVAGQGPAGGEVRLVRVPGDLTRYPAARCLVAEWSTGSGVVAVSA